MASGYPHSLACNHAYRNYPIGFCEMMNAAAIGKLPCSRRRWASWVVRNRNQNGDLVNHAAANLTVHVAKIRVVHHLVVAFAFRRTARMIVTDAMPERPTPAEAVAENLGTQREVPGRFKQLLL